MPEARWTGAAERVDKALPALGLARSRSHAAELIAAGLVMRAGDGDYTTPITKNSETISPGDRIAVESSELGHYVSRAALKLTAAFDAFAISAQGKLCLDVGASTGGFTQVLLEQGAMRVVAVDVGHNQLADSIRNDNRVKAVEGCNARNLTAETWQEISGDAELPQLIVADLSFISLRLIIPALAQVSAPETEWVLLVKPQFEVGREGVQGGIVRDAALRDAALQSVLDTAAQHGMRARCTIPSPIRGQHGNQEYIVWFMHNRK